MGKGAGELANRLQRWARAQWELQVCTGATENGVQFSWQGGFDGRTPDEVLN